MKTSLELDKDKVQLAKKMSDAGSLRELIDRALDSYISDLRRQSMLNVLGTDFFDGDLDRMRGKKDGGSRR